MRTLLKNALVLDTDHLYERLDVLVDGDGIIEKIAPDIPADGAAVVNLAGCTLLPGIIDAHVHVSNGGPLSAQVLKNWAKSGVTTVRDLGLMTPMAVEDYMAFLHEHEGPEYPRVLSTGKYVDIPGGYGSGPNPNEVIGLLTEDPAQAALAFGYASAAVSSLTAPLERVLRVKNKDLRASVSFEETEPRVYLKAEASIRIGQLLYLAIRLAFFYLRKVVL